MQFRCYMAFSNSVVSERTAGRASASHTNYGFAKVRAREISQLQNSSVVLCTFP